ncbi:mandelate racemase/muconate lactonizing enzyme family protein [Mesorhizobium sp. AaZ16]|uniref:mandelate racemase/muconate lactonizing enzyme family protein n=1 Tax=Mesorhizobium sp. AaZ16 TaxID=3402289 RepID=UPI00374E324A
MLQTQLSAKDSIKITGVTLHTVRTRRRTGAISSHIVLELATDAGIVGLGEISDLDCYRMYMPDPEAVRVGIEKVALGQNAFEIAALHERLLAYMPVYFRYANNYPPFTPASQIAAGVEMAFYDIVGKAFGTPVYNLIGGKVRDSFEITYPVFQAKKESDTERYLGYTAELVAEGVNRFRYYVGVDFDQDERFLKAFRDRFGNSVQLKALDFQGHFHWRDTLRIYERFKEYDFELIESPCWAEDYEGMSELRRRIDVDISEHISSQAQAMRMIKAGAVDVFNITIQSGGIYQAKKLFDLAEAAGLKCLISTTQEMSLGTAANAHLAAVIPQLHYAGDPVGPLLYVEDVVTEPLRYEGTRLIVPTGPGLGFELDRDKLEALRGPLLEWDRPAHGANYVSD